MCSPGFAFSAPRNLLQIKDQTICLLENMYAGLGDIFFIFMHIGKYCKTKMKELTIMLAQSEEKM